MALDLAGGKVYWTDPGTIRIQRANLDGTQVENLVSQSVAIQNRGNVPSPPTTLRYYRSTDSAITGDDTEVGTRPLRGLSAPETSFLLIRLRAPTTRGTYYHGACVEPVDGEIKTRNNCSPGVELRVR